MEKGYSIRKFGPKDLTSVMRLNRFFLPENYPSYFFLENFSRWPEGFLVSEAGGEIVGYVMCRVEKSLFQFKRVKMGHMLSIAVDKEHRRLGMGTNLVESVERGLGEAHGVDLIYLEVRISNDPAVSMYKKMDYEILGSISRYYGDGEDGHLMVKPMKDWVNHFVLKSVLGHRLRR